MSRKIAVIVAILLAFTGLTISAAGLFESIEVYRGNVKVFIDSRQVELEEQPFIYNGRVYVPIRFVSTALGREVDWNPEIRTVMINNPDIKLPLAECRPDEGEIFIYGEIVHINYENYTITIQQHMDDNSIQVKNPLQVSRNVVIVIQENAAKNIHFYQLKSKCTGGFILDSDGMVRGIII